MTYQIQFTVRAEEDMVPNVIREVLRNNAGTDIRIRPDARSDYQYQGEPLPDPKAKR